MNKLTYSKINEYREDQITQISRDHFKLNQFHDEIINLVLDLAIKQINAQFGPPPSPFSFFVMGSAGRFEQSFWSDQDHGIIFQDRSDLAKSYFLALGKEISDGLHQAGYEYCDGGVMSCNPLWCKSLSEWKQQIMDWIKESSWESIRHLLIFIDARSLIGDHRLVEQLKRSVYQTGEMEHLLLRALNNTLHLKKGIGVLGQILVETHGVHSGTLNIKDIAMRPYVNAVRLLAIQKNLMETSTLSRLDKLPIPNKELYKTMFIKLLEYRCTYGIHTDYETGHYLPVEHLEKEQKKVVKEIVKNGAALYQYTRKLIVRE